jgi:hypothetical protein
MLAAPWYISAQSMDIGSGAVVTIGVGTSMSYGTAASSGTVATAANTSLVIESTSVGSGSLICSGTPNATVKRYVTTTRWNMVTPTTTDITGQTFFDASGNDSWLTYFDETTGTNGGGAGVGWTYLTTLTDAVNVGQGYTYYPSANETVEFTGKLQSANLLPTITYTDGTHGYNVVGNPFPSAVDWNSDASWVLNNVEGTIWIYNGSAYVSYTQAASHDIPVGQGFFVHATGSSPAITIPASQRNHNNPTFLKSSESEIGEYESALIIIAQNNEFEDKIQISFGDNGTDGFDNGWDGTKMFGIAEAPQLYIIVDEYKQSYNHLPSLADGEERTVEMSYIPGAEGDQTLSADFSYLQDVAVTLEDLQTSTTQDFNENPTYHFSGSKDDDADRFLLHFAYSPDGIEDEESVVNSINIYSFGKQINISSVNELNGSVAIYDIMGRELYQKKLSNTQTEKFSINANNTYVIVKIITEGSIKTQKVFIK